MVNLCGKIIGSSGQYKTQLITTISSAVCLDQVDRSEEIRELKCLHVFHRECLEKWFLGDHYNCPLCHRAYFVAEPLPRSDYVWMV